MAAGAWRYGWGRGLPIMPASYLLKSLLLIFWEFYYPLYFASSVFLFLSAASYSIFYFFSNYIFSKAFIGFLASILSGSSKNAFFSGSFFGSNFFIGSIFFGSNFFSGSIYLAGSIFLAGSYFLSDSYFTNFRPYAGFVSSGLISSDSDITGILLTYVFFIFDSNFTEVFWEAAGALLAPKFGW